MFWLAAIGFREKKTTEEGKRNTATKKDLGLKITTGFQLIKIY